MSSAQLQGMLIGRIAVYRQEQQQGPVCLVAMHGALRAAADLAAIPSAMPDLDVWLVDLPGHGNAPFTPDGGGFDPERLATDVAAAVTRANANRPLILLGESFSGITALRLAGKLCNARHVILLDTPLDTTRMLPAQRVVMNRWETQPAQRAFLAALAQDFFGLDVESKQITPRSYANELIECHTDITMITGMNKEDSPAGVGAFFGEEDRQALLGANHINVIEIPGAGHSLLRVQPHATMAAIAAIVRQVIVAEQNRADQH